MSKSVERYGELRALLKLTEALSRARSVEQVYAFGLNAVHDLFRPDRAFVALSESSAMRVEEAKGVQAGQPDRSNWISDLVIPIRAGDVITGRFMLQYNRARGFSEGELAILDLIAAQCGAFVQFIRTRQEKDELVAMAVHELRAPLTTIIGGVSLLRTHVGEIAARAVAMIDRNARAQEKLIEDLLNISQLDAGKVELHLTTIDLVPLLEKLVEDIQPAAAVSQITILTDFHNPLPVLGDVQRLWQIFSNLISNSLRFASPNGVVRVTAFIEAGIVKTSISDDGIGIDPAHLPYIFERFRQAHPPRTRAYNGIGLGLAIAKDLVTMHHGTIRAESQGLGKGANFIVCLPAAN